MLSPNLSTAPSSFSSCNIRFLFSLFNIWLWSSFALNRRKPAHMLEDKLHLIKRNWSSLINQTIDQTQAQFIKRSYVRPELNLELKQTYIDENSGVVDKYQLIYITRWMQEKIINIIGVVYTMTCHNRKTCHNQQSIYDNTIVYKIYIIYLSCYGILLYFYAC